MNRRTTHVRRPASLALRIERLRTDSGMITQPMINDAVPAHAPKGPIDSAGNSRQPTYTGRERISQIGLNNTRRRLTGDEWGHYTASSRPRALVGSRGVRRIYEA